MWPACCIFCHRSSQFEPEWIFKIANFAKNSDFSKNQKDVKFVQISKFLLCVPWITNCMICMQIFRFWILPVFANTPAIRFWPFFNSLVYYMVGYRIIHFCIKIDVWKIQSVFSLFKIINVTSLLHFLPQIFPIWARMNF